MNRVQKLELLVSICCEKPTAGKAFEGLCLLEAAEQARPGIKIGPGCNSSHLKLLSISGTNAKHFRYVLSFENTFCMLCLEIQHVCRYMLPGGLVLLYTHLLNVWCLNSKGHINLIHFSLTVGLRRCNCFEMKELIFF